MRIVGIGKLVVYTKKLRKTRLLSVERACHRVYGRDARFVERLSRDKDRMRRKGRFEDCAERLRSFAASHARVGVITLNPACDR